MEFGINEGKDILIREYNTDSKFISEADFNQCLGITIKVITYKEESVSSSIKENQVVPEEPKKPKKQRKPRANKNKDFEIYEGCLLGYKGNAKTIRIPSEIYAIAANVFKDKDMEKVYIPNTVKYIDKKAFNNCKRLKEIHIDGVNYIDKYAFLHCPYATIYLKNQTGQYWHPKWNCYSNGLFRHNRCAVISKK